MPSSIIHCRSISVATRPYWIEEAGRDRIDLLGLAADTAAGGDGDGLVVKRVVNARQALVGASGAGVVLSRRPADPRPASRASGAVSRDPSRAANAAAHRAPRTCQCCVVDRAARRVSSGTSLSDGTLPRGRFRSRNRAGTSVGAGFDEIRDPCGGPPPTPFGLEFGVLAWYLAAYARIN